MCTVSSMFMIQQREALSPICRLSNDCDPSHSLVALFVGHYTWTYPTSIFPKTLHWNSGAPIVDNKNKWESTRPIDGYYVVGVTLIPYPRFEVIMNVISKEDVAYIVTIGDFP